jgi:microtubule-associated protein-like 1/2
MSRRRKCLQEPWPQEVRCIAVHPSRLTVATGQGGATYRREGEPCVRLWSAVSLATLHVLPAGGLARAVACLSFSKTDGGVFLAAVEEGPEHTLAVWDWARNARAAEARSSSETVVALEFHPVEDGAVVTCGRGHVTFWQLETGLGTLARRTGVLEPRDKPKYFTCLAFSSAGDLITGDSSGNVLVWGRGYNAVTQALWAVHEGPVFLVCVLRDGSLVTGGGRDRRLLRLDPEYRPTGELALLPEALGGPRALAQAGGGTLLLGTTAGSILRGSFGLGFQPVAASPGGEARAVAARPGTTQFLTGGTQLRLWDSLTHSLVWSHDPGEGAEAAAFSADGELVVVGMAGGRWLVLDARTREVVEEHQAGTEPLTSVAFSPHGGRLAVGSRGAVHLYTPGEDGRFLRAGRCAGAPGPLLPGLDWAEDGSRVMASTPEGEVVWDAALCRLLAEAGDLAWASSSAPLSWRTVAAWAEGPGPPTATCSSPGGGLLAAGTEAGELLLLAHPACQPAAAGPALPAHSGPVTRLVFLGEPAGLRLITAGLDGALLQWRVGAD